MNGRPLDNLIDNVHVVQGISNEYYNFPTQNPEKLIKIFIESSSYKGDLILDFFLGSATTTAVAHKIRRKWIGIELGDHFYPYEERIGVLGGVIVRMKEVLACKGNHEPCGISKAVNWHGGGFLIVADFDRVLKKQSSRIFYVSGALENTFKDDSVEIVLGKQGIREHVCLILEGGKDAFEKREKKYGFRS